MRAALSAHIEMERLRRKDGAARKKLPDHVLWERFVEIEQRDGIAPRPVAAELEVGDVHPVLGADGPEQADDARYVVVGGVEHVLAHFRVQIDALDLDE